MKHDRVIGRGLGLRSGKEAAQECLEDVRLNEVPDGADNEQEFHDNCHCCLLGARHS